MRCSSGCFVHRELDLADLGPILQQVGACPSSVILFIIANAGLFSYLITRAGVPDQIGACIIANC